MRRLRSWPNLLLFLAVGLALAAALVGSGPVGHSGHHHHGSPASWPLSLLAGGAAGVFLFSRRRGWTAFTLLALAVHFHPLPMPGQAHGSMPPICCVLAQSAQPEAPVAPPVRRLVVRLVPSQRLDTPDMAPHQGEPIRGPPAAAASPPRAA